MPFDMVFVGGGGGGGPIGLCRVFLFYLSRLKKQNFFFFFFGHKNKTQDIYIFFSG
jgi:hypothetical protein